MRQKSSSEAKLAIMATRAQQLVQAIQAGHFGGASMDEGFRFEYDDPVVGSYGGGAMGDFVSTHWRTLAAVGVVIVIGAAVGGGYYIYQKKHKPTPPSSSR